jgi:hypothetical protein
MPHHIGAMGAEESVLAHPGTQGSGASGEGLSSFPRPGLTMACKRRLAFGSSAYHGSN